MVLHLMRCRIMLKILQHRKISILELFIALSVQFSARAHIDPGDRTQSGGTRRAPCGELVEAYYTLWRTGQALKSAAAQVRTSRLDHGAGAGKKR